MQTHYLANAVSCCFCAEITNKVMPDEFRTLSGVDIRIVAATENFIALPSISPLVAGHILVLPRLHVTGLLQVPSMLDELVTLVSSLRSHLEQEFGPTVIFEHGVGRGHNGGCGVDHAHLHILPLAAQATAEAAARVAAAFGQATSGSFAQLAVNYDAESSYILFGSSVMSLDLRLTDNIPSQFIRKVIAGAIGKRQWNWREYFGWDEFVATWTAFN